MLSEDERGRILGALMEWAGLVPDLPTVGFLERGSGLLRPYELVEAVKEGTPDGEAMLKILEYGVRREGVETVARRIVSISGEW